MNSKFLKQALCLISAFGILNNCSDASSMGGNKGNSGNSISNNINNINNTGYKPAMLEDDDIMVDNSSNMDNNLFKSFGGEDFEAYHNLFREIKNGNKSSIRVIENTIKSIDEFMARGNKASYESSLNLQSTVSNTFKKVNTTYGDAKTYNNVVGVKGKKCAKTLDDNKQSIKALSKQISELQRVNNCIEGILYKHKTFKEEFDTKEIFKTYGKLRKDLGDRINKLKSFSQELKKTFDAKTASVSSEVDSAMNNVSFMQQPFQFNQLGNNQENNIINGDNNADVVQQNIQEIIDAEEEKDVDLSPNSKDGKNSSPNFDD